MTKFTKIATVAISAVVLALPAHASAETAAAAKAAAASAAVGAKSAEAQKVCLNVVPDTGSRITTRQCKTKAEWADEGVEFAPKK